MTREQLNNILEGAAYLRGRGRLCQDEEVKPMTLGVLMTGLIFSTLYKKCFMTM